MEDKKVLLSIEDLKVQFHVRGRILTAIRGISLDIYENESIAIVGESGSGKSVACKTIMRILSSNGYIKDGQILFDGKDLTKIEDEIANSRKTQVGSGDRSEKIRTYNYPQGRITDHRIGMSIYQMENFLNGDIDEMVDNLIAADRAERLKGEEE